MHFNNPYWSNKTRIELLEKWLAVHSTLYYVLDVNVVSDHMFDANCNQFMELSVADREAFINSKWYYIFKTFDGSTGFDLYAKATKADKEILMKTANSLLEYRRK